MNDKNNLSFSISYKPINQDIDIPGETTLLKNSIPLNTVLSRNTNTSISDETSASLFYKKTFKKPVQEFTAETNFYHLNLMRVMILQIQGIYMIRILRLTVMGRREDGYK